METVKFQGCAFTVMIYTKHNLQYSSTSSCLTRMSHVSIDHATQSRLYTKVINLRVTTFKGSIRLSEDPHFQLKVHF